MLIATRKILGKFCFLKPIVFSCLVCLFFWVPQKGMLTKYLLHLMPGKSMGESFIHA